MTATRSIHAAVSAGLLAVTLGLGTCANQGPAVVNPHAVPATRALPAETVIARYTGGIITAADLDAAIGAISGPERLEYTTPEPLREMVDALVDRKLMAQAARKAKLDQDPAVKSRLAASPGAAPAPPPDVVLAEEYLQRELRRAPPAVETDISRYYREHQAEFTVPARARVSRAVAVTEAAAERLRDDLAQAATLSQIRQKDPSHTAILDEVWIQDRPKKGEMETMALSLKPGAVSPVFRTDAGFAALRVEERVPARLRPLDEVRDGIRARLEEEGRQAAVSRVRVELRKGVTVHIDESALLSYATAVPSRR